MSRSVLSETVGAGGVVVAVPSADGGRVTRTVSALAEGGVRAIELRFDDAVGGTGSFVATLKDEGLMVGVGGITRASQAREVGALGADFVASAVTAPDVAAACSDLGLPCILSGLTPTEVWRALEMGADLVRVPAEVVGGVHYVRSLHGALPGIRRLMVAEMPLDGYLGYLEAGAEVLEFGDALANPGLMDQGDWREIYRRASRVIEDCDGWRAKHFHGEP